MTNDEVINLFAGQYAHFNNLAEMKDRPQYLSHYTSINVLEKIIQKGQLWFSNPLFMNDIQEVRFGIIEGMKAFDEIATEQSFIDRCGSSDRAKLLSQNFHHHIKEFDAKHAFDVYVFCLAEHDEDCKDGLLSMWRGYGADGNGAALVFKTDFIAIKKESPLLFVKVKYATEEQRIASIKSMIHTCLSLIEPNSIEDSQMHLVAYCIFDLLKFHSLISKHTGFSEEREWRIIYFPERDTLSLLKKQFSYFIGKNGIEPKLHFNIEPLKIDPVDDWKFIDILDKIILGPMHSNSLALSAVQRMFETLEKPEFKIKLSPSRIPFRSTR